jgi:hypothetical protein
MHRGNPAVHLWNEVRSIVSRHDVAAKPFCIVRIAQAFAGLEIFSGFPK